MPDVIVPPTFESLFGRMRDVQASAPGRLNIIGEHTDYNGGYVLPIATPQRTYVALARRRDRSVRIWSGDVPADRAFQEFELGHERRTGEWSDYAAGVTEALARSGTAIHGFDAQIQSNVPVGAGVSSSAALEVALLRAIDAAFGLHLDPMSIARLAHNAETGLVGAPVGVMDQMAASLADEHTALFIDTRTLAHESIPLPAGSELAAIHSGITHSHAAGEYRTRRAECDAAAARLGVALLAEATLAQSADADLQPPLDRRAHHVITENARVLLAREAMLAGDAATLGALMRASHASLRDDFEVSTPEIDELVGIANADPDVFGARLTGGGFGGSIVMLTRSGRAREAADRTASKFAAQTGGHPTVLVPPGR